MAVRILIVDDDRRIRTALSALFTEEGYETDVCASGEEGIAQIQEGAYDLVILDMVLPGMDGIETLSGIREHASGTDVIMMSGQSSIAMAVKATRMGARNFFEKPVNPEQLLLEIRHVCEEKRLRTQVDRLRSLVEEDACLVGDSPVMRRLREMIAQIAPADARVLITGENGTGKELVARALHGGNPRRDQPFVGLNCAAIPRDLVESELFGSEKGAFTGAAASRPGRFEQADGGTLFLDEIGDMSPDVQAKLLRVLEENEALRVGGRQPYRFDVRVLAATNKDLESEIRDGRFREDLYYRLNVIPLRVPALRERTEDIPRLAAHFLDSLSKRSGKGMRRWGEGALDLLAARSWPGNVRELRNVVERLFILSPDPVIGADFVRLHLPDAPGAASQESLPDGEASLKDRVQNYESAILRACYRETGGNVSKMARRLRVERAHLHRKLKAHGIRSGCADPAQQ